MSWESLKTKQDKNPDSEIDILFATLFNLPNGKKVTFSQMKQTTKFKIDHRSKAFKKIKKFF